MKQFSEKSARTQVKKLLKVANEKLGMNSVYLTPVCNSDGRFYVTDGIRAYRLNAPLPGVPCKENAEATEALDKIFGRYDVDYVAGRKCVYPEEKLEKAKKNGMERIVIQTNTTTSWNPILSPENEPEKPIYALYNIQYVRELLSLFPNASFYVFPKLGTLSPLYALSPDGDALLLPLRQQETA